MIEPSNVLKRIPLFASFPEEDRQSLVALLRQMILRKGETLFRQGDEGAALYLIVQGRIKISLSKRGDVITLAVLGQGEFLGEMALLDGLPRSADATAAEDSLLYVLNRRDFLSFLMNHEKAVHALLYSLSLRLRKTDTQLAELRFLSLADRLVRKLLELAAQQGADEEAGRGCALNLTQRELGDMLGVSRETVNKALKELRSVGSVSTSRNCIHIHDLALLSKTVR